MDWDAVVVGAGPAGSRSARLLAERGHRVLVLEEHPWVGSPVHCSGFVTPRTLQEAALPETPVLNAIRGAIVHGPGGGTLTLGGDAVRAYVLNRRALDERLAEEAQAAGALMQLRTRVLQLSRAEDGMEVLARRGGVLARHRARLVIGADGVRSLVARSLGGRLASEVIWCAGADLRLRGHPSEMVRIYVGRSVAPGWFAWTIPLRPGQVRLGVGTVMRPGAPKPRRLLDALLRRHPDHFQGMEVESLSGGFIPLYARRRTYGDRVLLVGDAASQVKPTSGGGIYMSLVAARHAAAVGDSALRRDDLSASVLAAYEAAWRRELGAELERGTDVRRTFLGLEDRELDRLVEIFGQSLLSPVINRYGDIDFPSPMFGRLLVMAPLLKAVLRIPDVVPSRWLRLLRPGWASR